MNRVHFLKALGLSGASLMAVLTACRQESVSPVTGPVDFDLDLNDSVNATLSWPGGFVVRNGVVVARIAPNRFVAVTQTCSHAGQQKISFQKGEFVCMAHGARFDVTGRGLNAEGQLGLTTYKIEQKGSILRVFS